MQYLLNEKEYNEIKRSEIILNEIKQYILDSLKNETHIDYICDRHGEKIPYNVIGTTININPFKVLKMLDVKLDGNIAINIIND